ncbi:MULTISPECIES: hypothetical protein [Mycobacteriaceae]|uniref:DUF4129 domain-containing protein n=1 Tax=Mycolicibacterium nivoides TaxID=2487344 RepID=A0ABW9LIR7_9MYCO|nr:hypothetical protein [Mycobacterium syngnathidarum]
MREYRSLIMGCALVLAMGFILPTMLQSAAKIGETFTDPDSANPPAPVNAPPPPAPDEPTDWSTVALVAVIAGAVLATAVLMWFAWRHLTKRGADKSEKRARRNDQIEMWQRGLDVLAETQDALMGFETDPESVYFTRPLLGDVNEPATATFYTALGSAQTLCTEIVPTDPVLITAFVNAANAARRAFDVADDNARNKARRGISHNGHKLSPQELRKIDQARKFMRQAHDPALTEAHARNALAKALDLLDGAGVVVPERLTATVTTSVETIHRKALDR